MVIENDNISQIAQQQQEVGQTERAAHVISQSMVVGYTYTNSRLALYPGLPHLQLLIACSMMTKTGDGEGLGTRLAVGSPTSAFQCMATSVVVPLSISNCFVSRR